MIPLKCDNVFERVFFNSHHKPINYSQKKNLQNLSEKKRNSKTNDASKFPLIVEIQKISALLIELCVSSFFFYF